MPQNFPRGVEVVASPLIINKNKEILLIKSPKWGDQYLIPGGHVEPGERLENAAKREGEEETGLKLKPLFCVNIGELINDPTFHRPAHLIYFHFVCEALTDELKLDGTEITEAIWVKPEKAATLLDKASRVKVTIKNYLNNVRINILPDDF